MLHSITVMLLLLLQAETIIAARFIIQLTKETSLNSFIDKNCAQIKEISSRKDQNALEVYSIGTQFKAFSGKFSNEVLKKLFDDPQVTSISFDRDLELQEYVFQDNAPPHLSRLSSTSPTSHQPFIYHSNSGIGVDIYILDTGIDFKHPNLQNVNGLKLADLTVSPIPSGSDPHGHGTAMAGLVASETFGVLKKCNLIDVRVADSMGKVKLSQVLRALSVTQSHINIADRPSILVLPMILLKKDQILNSALENISKNIAIILPAGNQNLQACQFSPTSCKKNGNMLVVGSLNEKNELASFSNYGDCVDVFTSGTGITTLLPSDSNKQSLIKEIHGSSSSCAIGAGVVGYYMSLGFNTTEAINKVKSISSNKSNNSHQYKILQLQP